MTTVKTGLTELSNNASQFLNANTTFAQLDQLVQASVVDKDLYTPPGSPANGALYIVATTSTPAGAWVGQGGNLAYWLSGSVNTWTFVTPREGWLVHVNDEDIYYKYTGSAWAAFGSGGTFTGGTLTSALNEAPPPTIASSSTPAIGAAAANSVFISGTTTITAFDTIAQGAVRRVVFTGALTLTHNGTSLVLPTSANITTAAGDSAEFLSLGSGNWRCVWYQRANGQALAATGGGFTGGTLTSALNEAPTVTIASAATVNIGAAAGNSISVTGTTTITAFDTIAAGAIRRAIFAGALTLTHNATSLILPGGASITTAAGDVAEFISLGSGNWRCTSYVRASGAPVSLTGLQLTGYSETLETMSALAIDVTVSNVKKKVMSANSTFTITGATSGRAHSFTLFIEGGTTYVATWPASFKWVTGAPPTLTAKHIISGSTIDGGTTWSVNDGGSYV